MATFASVPGEASSSSRPSPFNTRRAPGSASARRDSAASSGTDPWDPLSVALRPPADEGREAQIARLQASECATMRSKAIDERIAEDRKGWEKRRKAIKILLLGQAESGKSTTLKNFQIAFAPQQFRSERLAWRKVIQLNTIQSVIRILDVLNDEWEAAGTQTTRSGLSSDLKQIALRLSPLVHIGADLSARLSADTPQPATLKGKRSQELIVRAGSAWKSASHRVRGRGSRPDSAGDGDLMAVLAACREDIDALWRDSAVQGILSRRKICLQQMPGFFLNDIGRIATHSYDPTDDDILRARLRTLGVEEHRLLMENTLASTSEWLIYDVGGCRSNRHTWIPYFDDAQAIIFLAPLVFNQVLEEDPRVNRLEDSLTLWKTICSNELLSKTTLILFLNKMDILKVTLDAGVQLKKYVPTYGNQPNDIEHVTKYFSTRFKAYQRNLSPHPRTFYCHETSVTDRRSTGAILRGVREGVLRAHLEGTNII